MDKDQDSAAVLAGQVRQLGEVVTNLATRVQGFDSIFQKLNDRIDASRTDTQTSFKEFAKEIKGEQEVLVRKLEDRSKINWQPIGILVSVGGIALAATTGLLGYLITQQQAYTNKVETATVQAVGDLGRRIDSLDGKFWSKADIQARLNEMQKDIDRTDAQAAKTNEIASAAKMRDAFETNAKERMARIENTIESNRANVVPRGEHEREWSAQRERDNSMQRQIDEAKRYTSDLYGPRDELKRLQQRLDAIEAAKAAH